MGREKNDPSGGKINASGRFFARLLLCVVPRGLNARPKGRVFNFRRNRGHRVQNKNLDGWEMLSLPPMWILYIKDGAGPDNPG